MKKSRREFIKSTTMAGAASLLPGYSQIGLSKLRDMKKITIKTVNSNFEREPLIRPFGFKGGYHTEKWQTISLLQSTTGIKKIGLNSQGINWSDSSVFSAYSEAGGNALMYAITEFSNQLLKGQSFTNPIDLLDEIFDEVYQYGIKVTANPNLKKTFALNALVGIDNAIWMLYAAENGIRNFDDLIPEKYFPALSRHHKTVASIPLINYSTPISKIVQAADSGYYFLKIKIGQSGTQEEMLEKDKARLTEIHNAIGHYETEHSENGKLYYYLDANGRYEKKETLLKLIEHTKKIGAFIQIAIIEEPFPENAEIDVSDIPLRMAADESAHTDHDAMVRIQMGYNAIALKAIAKTMSMTMKIADVAHKNGVPCFCADLTVNPILVDWNKNIAARLDAFPGIGTGLLETNGHQNYENWAIMESYHPYTNAGWMKIKDGIFELGEDFYSSSAGIFINSEHYLGLVDSRI